MTLINLTFHNHARISVQAQIFTGRTLISTCVASPGEICVLPVDTDQFDIFFKNSATGWEVARKLNNEARTLTLSQHKGRYILT
ncbi:MAG: hypothetical protein IPM53_24355 [Anaerolineaceae bacterium]|nr:hypothetical protein [Anaerolineaceae bacterium]